MQNHATQKVALVNSTTNTKKYLGYKKGQTEPGLVAFYDIRPGNGAVDSFNHGVRTQRFSTQLISTCPRVGRVSAMIAFSVVDLPAPFGPSRPKISPASTAKLLSTTATFLASLLSTPRPRPRFRPRHCGRPRLNSLPRFFTTRTADCPHTNSFHRSRYPDTGKPPDIS